MFEVLSFSLGIRMSLSVEGAGHMPRRCAATPLYTFFGGKLICLHAKSRYKKEKGFPSVKYQNGNADSGWQSTLFPSIPSISSLRVRVPCISRQKRDGPNPTEMDIKLFLSTRTFCLQAKGCILHNWERLNNSFIRKKRSKMRK